MTRTNTDFPAIAMPAVSPQDAFQEVQASFDRFCLISGIGALEEMLEEDANALCGARYNRNHERQAHRWGATEGPVGFHGGKTKVRRPRVRGKQGKEIPLPSWRAAQEEDWLGKWAMNLMLINVSTRKFARAVRLPEGDLPAEPGDGTSKSAASRRFVALSAARMREWMHAELSGLDLLAIQIDGLRITQDLVLVAAVGIDGEGEKHPLAVMEGATENTAVVQALLDNLIERGLDPGICRLFIVDGAKALKKAIRNTFGPHTPIQRCQVHKPALGLVPGGAQHPRPSAQGPACAGAQGAPAGLGIGRCGQGRKAPAQSGAAAGEPGAGRGGQHSGRDRRNPDGKPPWPARRSAPLAGLHQHHRKHDGHHPAGEPKRQTLAQCFNGAALDRGGHAGGQKGVPPHQCLQAVARAKSGASRPSGQTCAEH